MGINVIPWSEKPDIDKDIANAGALIKSIAKKAFVAGEPAFRADYDPNKDKNKYMALGLSDPPSQSLNRVTFYHNGYQYSLIADGKPDILDGLVKTFKFTK